VLLLVDKVDANKPHLCIAPKRYSQFIKMANSDLEKIYVEINENVIESKIKETHYIL